MAEAVAQFSRNIDDEELAQRHSSKEAEEGKCTIVIVRIRGKSDCGSSERRLNRYMAGGQTGDEETGHTEYRTTGACSRSLDDGVFPGGRIC